MKATFLVAFLFIFFSQHSYSQKKEAYEVGESIIDSIENISKSNLEQAVKIGEKALAFYKQKGLNELEGKVGIAVAKAYDFHEKYDSSTVYYKKSISPLILAGDSNLVIKCYVNIGVTFYYNGNYTFAVENYLQAEKYISTKTDPDLRYKIFNNLGLVNKAIGKYKTAIKYFQKVVSLHEGEEANLNLANTYLNLGTICWEQKNYQSALKNLETSKIIYLERGKPRDIAAVYNNMALVYNALNDTARALGLHDKAIEICEQANDFTGLGIAMSNKAVLLDAYGMKKDAELLFLQSLDLFEKSSYHTGIFTNRINLSRLYSEIGENNKAKNLALLAISDTKASKPVKYLAEGYEILAQTFSDLGDFKLSVEYYEKYLELRDSIFSVEKSKQIAEMQEKYENEKIQSELKVKKIEADSNKRKLLLVSILLIMSLFFLIGLVLMYQKIRKTYRKLVKQNLQLTIKEIELEKETAMLFDKPEIEISNNSSIDQGQKDQLMIGLKRLMEVDKVFVKEQIQITDIAKMLGTNRNYLSVVVNEFYGDNFNNFINDYRIKESRKLFISPDYKNYTIEAIGQAVGFHSKASFNSAFKKFTGVTPSFFRDNIHDNS